MKRERGETKVGPMKAKAHPVEQGGLRAEANKVRTVAALARELDKRRRSGLRVVLANGVFDILHAGHARFMREARSAGDILVVAVNDDDSTRRLKGESRPLVPVAERMELLAALACVDFVVPFHGLTADEVIRTLKPDFHAKGPDWTPETVPEAQAVREVGAKTLIVGGARIRSTSWIIDRVLGKTGRG